MLQQRVHNAKLLKELKMKPTNRRGMLQLTMGATLVTLLIPRIKQAPGTNSLEQQAMALIARLRASGQSTLVNPVSRLQRELRLAYTPAYALAYKLMHQGEWTIAVNSEGTRYARIHSKGQEERAKTIVQSG